MRQSVCGDTLSLYTSNARGPCQRQRQQPCVARSGPMRPLLRLSPHTPTCSSSTAAHACWLAIRETIAGSWGFVGGGATRCSCMLYACRTHRPSCHLQRTCRRAGAGCFDAAAPKAGHCAACGATCIACARPPSACPHPLLFRHSHGEGAAAEAGGGCALGGGRGLVTAYYCGPPEAPPLACRRRHLGSCCPPAWRTPS